MKAISFADYGPPEVLRPEERPQPEPMSDEIVIRVQNASVNPADWRFRKGTFRRTMPLKLPFIPGNDVAGIMVSTGQNVSAFDVGARVFAMSPLKQGGGYAEFIAVNARLLAHCPDSLSLSDAAALPLAGLTALQALREHAQIKQGDSLLIIGASGGVGHFAVQIGKALGATVTAVSSVRNFELTRSLGADATLNYGEPEILNGPKTYDVIFDAVAIEPFTYWKGLLKPGGALVTVNPIIGKIIPRNVTRLLGISRLHSFFVKPDAADLAYLAVLAEQGKLRPVIEHIFALEDASQAHRLSETCRVRGKIVLDIQNKL